MRDFARFLPRFWNGDTGKKIRKHGGAPGMLVASYLFTSPASNMIGLYPIAIPTIAHDTGMKPESVARVLERLALEEVDFALFDDDQDIVWVKQGVVYQVAPNLSAGDNRIKSVLRELAQMRRSRFYPLFIARYNESLSLGFDPSKSAPHKLHKGSPDPLPSQEKEHEQENEQDRTTDPPLPPFGGQDEIASPLELVERDNSPAQRPLLLEPNPQGQGLVVSRRQRPRERAVEALCHKHYRQACDVLALLNAARQRVKPGRARNISPTVDTLRWIAERLEAGATRDQFEHVIAVCEAESLDDDESFRFFSHDTPFRRENFARKLAMVPEAGRRVVTGGQPARHLRDDEGYSEGEDKPF